MARVPKKPLKPPFSKWYNQNVYCDYHYRVQGHSTKNYHALTFQVQIVVNAGYLNFANITSNPLPYRIWPKVNVVAAKEDRAEKLSYSE